MLFLNCWYTLANVLKLLFIYTNYIQLDQLGNSLARVMLTKVIRWGHYRWADMYTFSGYIFLQLHNEFHQEQ